MSNWLEKIQSLTAGMLFIQGYVLPFETVPPPSKTGDRERAVAVSMGAIRRCAEACRSIVHRPRLVQPH